MSVPWRQRHGWHCPRVGPGVTCHDSKRPAPADIEANRWPDVAPVPRLLAARPGRRLRGNRIEIRPDRGVAARSVVRQRVAGLRRPWGAPRDGWRETVVPRRYSMTRGSQWGGGRCGARRVVGGAAALGGGWSVQPSVGGGDRGEPRRRRRVRSQLSATRAAATQLSVAAGLRHRDFEYAVRHGQPARVERQPARSLVVGFALRQGVNIASNWTTWARLLEDATSAGALRRPSRRAQAR
jgi:hypothetical protein